MTGPARSVPVALRVAGTVKAVGAWDRLTEGYRRRQVEAAERRDEARWKLLERPLWRTMAAPVAAVLVLAIGTLVPSYFGERRDDRAVAGLAKEGVSADATAQRFRIHVGRYALFYADSVQVRFAESGQAVTAWVPASHLPDRGEVVPVRYVRSDPTVVRLQGDERPYGGRWRWGLLLFGSVTLVVLTCVGIYRWAMRRFYDLD